MTEAPPPNCRRGLASRNSSSRFVRQARPGGMPRRLLLYRERDFKLASPWAWDEVGRRYVG